MDRLAEKPAEIESRRTAAAGRYPTLWQRMMTEWLRPDESDRAWLLYSANYLFRTAGVRWALDPLTLRQRVPSTAKVDVSALAALDFIVLTHRHADHLDLDLLRELRDFPIRWIVPEFLLDALRPLDLPRQKLIVPHPRQPLQLGGLTLTPFDGLHWSIDVSPSGERRGVPAMGYLAEFAGNRWLFPGDTREYDAGQLPSFGRVDCAFVHLWLGRASALLAESPLLAAFCRFCVELQSPRIVITHLHELGREAVDYWDDGHFRQVKKWLNENAHDIRVESAEMGKCIQWNC